MSNVTCCRELNCVLSIPTRCSSRRHFKTKLGRGCSVTSRGRQRRRRVHLSVPQWFWLLPAGSVARSGGKSGPIWQRCPQVEIIDYSASSFLLHPLIQNVRVCEFGVTRVFIATVMMAVDFTLLGHMYGPIFNFARKKKNAW